MSLEIVLVAALLSSQPAAPGPTTQLFVEVLKPAFLAVAINAELLDLREADTAELLKLLQQRNAELRDVPHLTELARFPDKAFLTQALAANRAYRGWLVARLEVDLIFADDIRDAICETDALFWLFDTLRDAAFAPYYVVVRRESLGTVRRMIGDAAFYSGEMPAPIPMRHISRN